MPTGIKPAPPYGRTGKTERDHTSGAWARRLTNQEARGNWDRQINERGGKRPLFPVEVCNGRKTRALVAASKRVKKAKGGPGGGTK